MRGRIQHRRKEISLQEVEARSAWLESELTATLGQLGLEQTAIQPVVSLPTPVPAAIRPVVSLPAPVPAIQPVVSFPAPVPAVQPVVSLPALVPATVHPMVSLPALVPAAVQSVVSFSASAPTASQPTPGGETLDKRVTQMADFTAHVEFHTDHLLDHSEETGSMDTDPLECPAHSWMVTLLVWSHCFCPRV